LSNKSIKKPINPKELEVYEDLDRRARFIILDGANDPLIPHFSEKNTTYHMWMALKNLF